MLPPTGNMGLVTYEGEIPKGSWRRRGVRVVLFLASVSAVGACMVGAIVYAFFAREVPDFQSLEDYQPKGITSVYSQAGQLLGEFYEERRTVLPYHELPPRLIQAFTASEDARFFEHGGIDYWGIARAAMANLRAGRVVQGGSTITQQVAKSLLISAEGYREGTAKKLSRKIKEAILARRLEQKLTKKDILTIYLNQIFLGNNAYGVAAAAQNYFRKPVRNLNLAEMALLAGLPQAPSRYSPFAHPERARKRREYVLSRMLAGGFISEAEVQEAKSTEIVIYRVPNVAKEVAPYFTEHVRRALIERFGEERLLRGGLTVETTVDVERYRLAEDAAYKRLRMVDKRQGYRGPLARLQTQKAVNDFLKAYEKELLRTERFSELKLGELYVGVITGIDRKNHNISLQVGPHKAILPLAAMRWARKVDPQVWFERGLLKKIPANFKRGDALLVRRTNLKNLRKDRFALSYLRSIPKDRDRPLVALEQEPNLETALISVESKSGYILAMLGGYSYDRSEFNRALQACRQPGSAFKPIVYTAALDLRGWTASTKILDAPMTFDDPSAARRWKPNNFNVQFEGEVTLRTALKNSMNVPAIRILKAVRLKHGIAYAKKLGIKSQLREELGLALGSSCVTMGELTEVYQLFSNYGAKVKRRAITRIVDAQGKVLLDQGYYQDPWSDIALKIQRALRRSSKPTEQVIDRQTGFLITKLMRNVVTEGTGMGAKKVGVPVAGKTGTTNDSFDAWFVGFSRDITTAVWVGYDDYVTPMGRYEQGGRAALPLWVDYMKGAIKKKTGEFEPPEGIVMVRIDPKTGKLAHRSTPGAVEEAFREGKEPKEYAARDGEARSDEFFMIDN